MMPLGTLQGLTTLLLISFMAFFLAFLSLLGIFFPQTSLLEQQLKPFEEAWQRSRGKEEQKKEQIKFILSRIPRIIAPLTAKRGSLKELQLLLDQAGLPLRASEFMFFHFLTVLILGSLGYTLSKSIIVMFLMVSIAAIVPILIIQYLKTKREGLFHEQLPDTLSLIAGALKAGYSFLQAVDMVVQETKPPMSTEFKRALTEARLGLPLEEALNNMAERVQSINFEWTIMAVKIQREVGGNLAEVLEILANTMRERDRVARQIRVLTAEGRLSAAILTSLPFITSLILYIINPSYVTSLFTNTMGIVMVIAALILMTIGGLWLKKMVSIEV